MPMASHCFTSHSFNPKSFKDFTCESPIFTELGYPLQDFHQPRSDRRSSQPIIRRNNLHTELAQGPKTPRPISIK